MHRITADSAKTCWVSLGDMKTDFATRLPNLASVTPHSHSGGGLSGDIADQICLCTRDPKKQLYANNLSWLMFRCLILNAPCNVIQE
ncbi:hypothetical protein CEXT_538951 [Caerostris extrusa]|uniref:Uncharacterized protein n=1 Tax=Caerostris extrusa TaxID=172846 RepID=A0AAV4NF05_CAEEX|nr:hypothetical protein CEXT_538951 [Caerostris extrusa]